MNDIRQMNLLASISSDDEMKYGRDIIMTPEQNETIEAFIPQIFSLDYWDPIFQAWFPFMESYLSKCIRPDFTSLYLEQLTTKEPRFGLKPSCLSTVFNQFEHLRKYDFPCFYETPWEDVESFTEDIHTILEHEKEIRRSMGNFSHFEKVLRELIQVEEGAQYAISKNLVQAIYLYRLSNFSTSIVPADCKNAMQEQCNAWAEVYKAHYSFIRDLFKDKLDIFTWYAHDLIIHKVEQAWKTALDTSEERSIITGIDAYAIPPIASNALVYYINKLPCVSPRGLSRADLVEVLYHTYATYVENPKNVSNFPSLIYCFMLGQRSLRSVLNDLCDVYWNVKEGTFIKQIISQYSSLYYDGKGINDMTPDEYVECLVRLGYPVEE